MLQRKYLEERRISNLSRSLKLKEYWAKKKQELTGGMNLHLLVDRIVIFAQKLSRITYFEYQKPLAKRIVESILFNEGAELTGTWARQIGKSQIVASIIAACAVLLPIFARAMPQVKLLQKYKDGFWVGLFAPSDEQADTILMKAYSILNHDDIKVLLQDKDLNTEVEKAGDVIRILNGPGSGSCIRKHSLDERAKVESKTYHLIVIDEAQDANSKKVRMSVTPMGAFVNATIVKIGVAGVQKCDFLDAINRNKRIKLMNKMAKQNHFECDYLVAQKFNSDYKKFIKGEINRIGIDSDEFQRNYCLRWNLEQGMFITYEKFEALGVKADLVKATSDLCIGGIDLGKSGDSTVCTILSECASTGTPDIGYKVEDGKLIPTYPSKEPEPTNKIWRILNWREIHGENWEQIFAEIVEFLKNYPNLVRLGVDATGVGDPIYDRLASLLESTKIETIPIKMTRPMKSDLYKNFDTMLRRDQIWWPSSMGAQNSMEYKRFKQQMCDMEKTWMGQYMICNHPVERGAHDDFVDSLAIAAWCAKDELMPEMDTSWDINPFISKDRDQINNLTRSEDFLSPALVGLHY